MNNIIKSKRRIDCLKTKISLINEKTRRITNPQYLIHAYFEIERLKIEIAKEYEEIKCLKALSFSKNRKIRKENRNGFKRFI